MKFSKFFIPVFAAVGVIAGAAQAQVCNTIDGSQGTLNMSFAGTSSSTAAECVFELGQPSGAAIVCVRGLPGSLVPLLTLIVNQGTLTATQKASLTGATSIRGGFSYRTVGGQARTTVMSTRTAFNNFINGNLSVADSLPTTVTTVLNTTANSVRSIAVAGTSGIIDGYHASGNVGSTSATQFQLIMDAPAITNVFFLQVGADRRVWTVCTGSLPAFTADLLGVAQEFQVGGSPAQKVLLRN